MARGATKTKIRSGRCPTHGDVQATKDVPVFQAPGLYWSGRYLASLFEPYRCPQCGQKVK